MNINDPPENASLINAMEGKCLEMSDNPVQTIIAGFASLYPCGYRFDFSSFKVLSFNLSLSNCISSMIPKASKIACHHKVNISLLPCREL